MENQINYLLEFILKNFPKVHFEVIHNSFSPTLKHFIVKENIAYKGFGTDHNYLLAIEKSYSEFIERKTFQQLNDLFGSFKTSNGFAAHLTPAKAKISSIYELIERDALLVTWHGKAAPYWLGESESASFLSAENLEIFNQHKKLGLQIALGVVALTNNVLTCIAKVQGTSAGKDFFYIDTKSGKKLSNLLNDLVESISFYSHYINLGHSKQIRKTHIDQPIDHFYYYLNHTNRVEWFHKGSSKVLDIPSQEIQTYLIQPEEYLDGQNFKRIIAFSDSNQMQQYYCGKPDVKKLNLCRFEQVFGENFKINKQTHPLS